MALLLHPIIYIFIIVNKSGVNIDHLNHPAVVYIAGRTSVLVQLTTEFPWKNEYSKVWGQMTIRLILSVAVSFFKHQSH